MKDDQQGPRPPQEEPEEGLLAPGDESAEDAGEDSSPKIKINWQPRNQRSTYAATVQLITLLFMLAALVAIFMFKDRCGESVSGVIFMVNPDAQVAPAPAVAPPKAASPD